MLKFSYQANPVPWVAAAWSLMLGACSGAGEPTPGVTASPAASILASERPSSSQQPSPTARPSPIDRAATIVASIPFDGLAQGAHIALSDDSVWVRFVDGSVARVDAKTNTIVATIPVGTGEFGSLAVGEGAVWVTTFDEDKVSRIDPATNKVVAEVAVGTNPEGIAVTPGAVWVSNHRAGSISRIDPATNTVVATITFGKTGPSGPKEIEISHDNLWTSVPNMGFVVRIDPATNKVVATIKVVAVENLVIGSEAVYAFGFGGQLYEIDAVTNEVARKFRPDQAPWTFHAGAYWGSDGKDVLRLAPNTFTPIERWRVAGKQTGYADLAFGDGSVWLLTDAASLLHIELQP